MRAHIARAGSLVICAWALAGVAAERRFVRRELSLGGAHGTVAVEVPSEWRFEGFPHASPPSATVRFGPAADKFDFRLGFLWLEPGMRVPLETVKERVRIAANDALLKSVETEAKLVEIRGKETAGYYYSLTDKFPSKSPGGYPYLVQGIAVTGPVTNVFTLLSQTADPAERERGLAVIASATWSDGPVAAPAPPPVAPASPPTPRDQDLVSVRIEESQGAYRLTVPISHFVLTIRKGGLERATKPGNQSPGYFLLRDEGQAIVVSGWFESSEHYAGLEKLWERELASLKRQSSAAPQDVKFTKVGRWDAIVYHQQLPGGTTAHVRAEWSAEGTWVDLHLSLSGKRPTADARASLLELLEAFRVEDKD